MPDLPVRRDAGRVPYASAGGGIVDLGHRAGHLPRTVGDRPAQRGGGHSHHPGWPRRDRRARERRRHQGHVDHPAAPDIPDDRLPGTESESNRGYLPGLRRGEPIERANRTGRGTTAIRHGRLLDSGGPGNPLPGLPGGEQAGHHHRARILRQRPDVLLRQLEGRQRPGRLHALGPLRDQRQYRLMAPGGLGRQPACGRARAEVGAGRDIHPDRPGTRPVHRRRRGGEQTFGRPVGQQGLHGIHRPGRSESTGGTDRVG